MAAGFVGAAAGLLKDLLKDDEGFVFLLFSAAPLFTCPRKLCLCPDATRHLVAEMTLLRSGDHFLPPPMEAEEAGAGAATAGEGRVPFLPPPLEEGGTAEGGAATAGEGRDHFLPPPIEAGGGAGAATARGGGDQAFLARVPPFAAMFGFGFVFTAGPGRLHFFFEVPPPPRLEHEDAKMFAFAFTAGSGRIHFFFEAPPPPPAARLEDESAVMFGFAFTAGSGRSHFFFDTPPPPR